MRDDGIAQCLGAFYAAHRQELFTYALSITRSGSLAEDAIHDAFAGILANRKLPAELRPYVFRCVRNASLDLMRAMERDRRKTDGFASIFQPGRGSALQETAEEILAALPEKEREIVVLKVYSGLTLKEIAGVSGKRLGTVATLYRRCLQKLRDRYRGVSEPGPAAVEELP